MDVIWQALTDMVVSGAGLLIVAAAYFLWWLSGFVPNLFSEKQWSWKRGLQDFCKVLLMAIILIAGAGLADVGSAFFYHFGWDIRDGVEAVSTFALIGAMSVGFLFYLTKAINNAVNFLKLKWSESKGDKEKFEESRAVLQEEVKEFVEHIAPAVEPDIQVKAVPQKEAAKAIEEAQFGSSVPVAAILEQLKAYATKKAFLKEDGTSGIYRGQCTQVPAFVYNQVGVTGAMGNGKDVVKNLIARGVAEPCGEEPGAIASADDGSQYGHTWVSLGNGYLVEQNAHVAGTTTANYGAGTVYSCRVGKVNDWNRGKITYCRLKGLLAAATAPAQQPTPAETPKPAATTTAPKSNVVEYTYKTGDTFGQVLLNLGLSDSANLWGGRQDVAYYTEQLHQQGITGNIPVGTTIKLTPRK